MSVPVQLLAGTASEWAAHNIVVPERELAFLVDGAGVVLGLKMGDGVSAWAALPWVSLPVAWGDVSGKPSAFPPSGHNHAIADVNGLQAALDGKQVVGNYAAATHGHAIADVGGLQAALDGKQAAGSYAAAVHGHGIGDISGLQSALDDKAAISHGHAIANVAGLQAALDARQPLAAVLSNTTAAFTLAQEAKLAGIATGAERFGVHVPLPLAAGQFFSQAINATAPGTIAAAANRLDLFPFIPSRNVTIDEIAVEVTTAVASALCRLAIYSDVNGLPSAILAQSASTLDCSTVGVKNASVTLAMTAGTRYWLAVLSNSTQTYRGIAVASLLPLSEPAALTAHSTVIRATQTFASGFPSTAPTATLTSTIAPRFRMRVAP